MKKTLFQTQNLFIHKLQGIRRLKNAQNIRPHYIYRYFSNLNSKETASAQDQNLKAEKLQGREEQIKQGEEESHNVRDIARSEEAQSLLAKLEVLESSPIEKSIQQKQIKSLNQKYGKIKSDDGYSLRIVFRAVNYLLPHPGKSQTKDRNKTLAAQLQQGLDSMFFEYEKQPVQQQSEQELNKPSQTDDKQNKLISLDTSEQSGLMNKLEFEEKRRLVFEDKDSLALKSLQDGIVDFADKRVNFRGTVDQSLTQGLKQNGKNFEFLEVDLGELKSLQENQIHIDELTQDMKQQLQKGKQVVDDSQLDSSKYKLVLKHINLFKNNLSDDQLKLYSQDRSQILKPSIFPLQRCKQSSQFQVIHIFKVF